MAQVRFLVLVSDINLSALWGSFQMVLGISSLDIICKKPSKFDSYLLRLIDSSAIHSSYAKETKKNYLVQWKGSSVGRAKT